MPIRNVRNSSMPLLFSASQLSYAELFAVDTQLVYKCLILSFHIKYKDCVKSFCN